MFQISPLDSAQYKKGIPVNRKVKQRENKTIPKETPSIHTQEIKTIQIIEQSSQNRNI
jgi:hypothetical protein